MGFVKERKVEVRGNSITESSETWTSEVASAFHNLNEENYNVAKTSMQLLWELPQKIFPSCTINLHFLSIKYDENIM